MTSTTSRLSDTFTTASTPCAARLLVCVSVWLLRMPRRQRATLLRQHSDGNCADTAEKSANWLQLGSPSDACVDGRRAPTPSRHARGLRYAAEIAVSRNIQQSTAGAFVTRWKHEVQVAILRRWAAMTRAVLPRATARELWLLTEVVNRDDGDDARAPPLDEDGITDPMSDLESLASADREGISRGRNADEA